ncbi:MAG TPA: DUF6173 family protein [Brevundimonas sp.]|jgi:hypothetical protein|uniref:DUF6173 family protein n=1 Tax=Brevundimonas sp. TaxID=1871086 RepID=UPI002DF224E9|nr:DUF6173 family protein [Brevundimonas sp.]
MSDATPVTAPPDMFSDCAGEPCPEPVLPGAAPERLKAMTTGVRMRESPAEWAFVRLSKLIEDFEKGLDRDEEIGATIVGLPGDATLKFDEVGFWAPDLLLFSGKNADGKPVRVIQHYAALNVTLSSTKKPEEREARRIGFQLSELVEKTNPQPKAARRKS